MRDWVEEGGTTAALPEWLSHGEAGEEDYTPPRDRDNFIQKSILSILSVLSGMRFRRGREGKLSPNPALFLFTVLCLVVLTALSGGAVFPLLVLTGLLVRLGMMDGREILSILKASCAALFFSLLILAPSVFLGNRPGNLLRLLCKVFDTVTLLSVLARTVSFNRLTSGLKTFRVPDLLILTLDLTLNYIALLGESCVRMLEALKLRSVGRNRGKQKAVTGILGVTFLKSREMAEEMYEAMQCRGFTGSYERSSGKGSAAGNGLCAAVLIAAGGLFLLTGG